MDIEKRQGIWRQPRKLDGTPTSAGGDAIDPKPNPEEALIAKEEKGEPDGPIPFVKPMSPEENRRRIAELQKKEEKDERFDKAA